MKIKNLSKTYTPRSGEVRALDSINFELPEKGIIFILGKSGSGKSTLLNVLGGLDKADEGSVIEVCGTNIASCSLRECDQYRNSYCGFVFQEYNLIPELNVKENIRLSCEMLGDKYNSDVVDKTLQRVGLDGYGERKITELSGGQKQRVAIARAIVKDPKIIFADEPTGALDESTGESIFNLLKEISQERLVLVVSHDREFATKYADRIIELADGKIISDSDGVYVADEQAKVVLKKPRLPIKVAAKIGCVNFKVHPIRLVATILLSVIAFTFLGVALASALNSYTNIVYNAMLADDVTYSSINRENDDKKNTAVTATEKRSIDEAVGFSFGVVAIDSIGLSDVADNLYDNALPIGFAVITPNLIEKCGFTVVGRLPELVDDIALTFFSAEIINRLEFKKQNVLDIIGERLNVGERICSVVGVIDTHFDSGKFNALKTTDEYNMLAEMYDITLRTSIHNLVFVSDHVESFCGNYDTVIVKNSKNVVPYISGSDGLRLYNYTIQKANSHKKTISGIKVASSIIATIFSFFAVILFLNFLLQSFVDKLFTLGVLKANGCNNIELMKVFLCESFVLATVVFMLTSVATIACCLCLNAHFGIAFFGAYFSVFPLLFMVVFVTSILGCSLPIIKIMHMTSVDIIKIV